MLVKFKEQYAGREVGDIVNLDASLALMLTRDGKTERVESATPVKPKEVNPIPVKAEKKPAKPRKSKG